MFLSMIIRISTLILKKYIFKRMNEDYTIDQLDYDEHFWSMIGLWFLDIEWRMVML